MRHLVRTTILVILAAAVAGCAVAGPRVVNGCVDVTSIDGSAVRLPFSATIAHATYGDNDRVVYVLTSRQREGYVMWYAPFGGIATSFERKLLYVLESLEAADGREMSIRIERDDRYRLYLVGDVTSASGAEFQIDLKLPESFLEEDPTVALFAERESDIYDPFAADVFAVFEQAGDAAPCQ